MSSSIAGITTSVEHVKGLVDQVNVASQQQAQGIAQVSQAIAQMEKVTQTTAATAEESAASSEELNAQADTTMTVVHQLEALVGGRMEAPAPPARQTTGAWPTASVVKLQSRRQNPRPPAEDSLPVDPTGTFGSF